MSVAFGRHRSRARSAAARVREALSLVPPPAWLCALAATLLAATWSMLLPPFQGPDEAAHYAYVERLVQAGAPPAEHKAVDPYRREFSPDLRAARRGLRTDLTMLHPNDKGVWSPLEQRALERDLHAHLSRAAAGYSYSAAPEPPLYYALEAVPYALASHGTTLQRLALMRLGSALLAGVTVLLVFLFLREALPAVPAAWTIGALGVALQPMFIAASSSVDPDALLFAASAGTFLCLARALRRGLEPALSVAAGAVIAIGFLAKLSFIGLLPGVAAGLLLAAWRQPGGSRRALRLLALAAVVAAIPVLAEIALNAAWHRPALGLVARNARGLAGAPWSLRLTYAWEFYLPPLPGMRHLLVYDSTREWLRDMTGSFGIFETVFPTPVSDVGSVALAAVGALGLVELWRRRRSVRRRALELLVYALAGGGLLALVAAQSLSVDRQFGGNGSGAELRYLLPLVPFYAALLALASRAMGRRRVAILGTVIVGLALAHTLFSELLVIGRYYA